MAKYWLMKSEPGVYSIDDLKKEKKTWWECIRNYQARNFMIKDMKVGDEVLFYHSSADPAGVAGQARVSAPAAADKTAQDKKSEYYDPKATKENPIWQCVQVEFVTKFKNFVPIEQIRKTKGLEKMLLLKRGQRLSIQPITAEEFAIISKLGQK